MPRLSVLLLAVLVAGCSTNPNRPGRAVRATDQIRQHSPDHDAWRRLGYRYEWTGFPHITRGEELSFVHPYTDVVATLESGSTVTLMEGETGRVRWRNTLANPLTRFVGLSRDSQHIIAASDTELYLLQLESGDIVDRQRLERVANTAPAVAGDLAVFGTASGELTGHRLSIGFRQWGNAAAGSAFDYAPVVAKNAFCAVSRDGDVLFVGAGGSRTGANKIFGGPGAQPVAGNGLFYVASADQSIYAFDPEGGTQVWRHRTQHPLDTAPAFIENSLYCTTTDGGLTAFRGASGQVLWYNQDVRGEVVARRKGELLVWDGTTAVTVDERTGDELQRAELPGVTDLKADRIDAGSVYATTDNGLVLRFVPRR